MKLYIIVELTEDAVVRPIKSVTDKKDVETLLAEDENNRQCIEIDFTVDMYINFSVPEEDEDDDSQD